LRYGILNLAFKSENKRKQKLISKPNWAGSDETLGPQPAPAHGADDKGLRVSDTEAGEEQTDGKTHHR
jgi:hypothetical protein